MQAVTAHVSHSHNDLAVILPQNRPQRDENNNFSSFSLFLDFPLFVSHSICIQIPTQKIEGLFIFSPNPNYSRGGFMSLTRAPQGASNWPSRLSGRRRQV